MPVISYEIYDLFICHASEDKETFVRPLAQGLRARGLKVWYDEYTLQPGDSLRERIDHGLATTRRAVIVLSPNFFKKAWVQWEMNGLVQRHLAESQSMLIPVWLDVTADDVRTYSPPLADLIGVRSVGGPEAVADAIVEALSKKFWTDPGNAQQALLSTLALLNLNREKGLRLTLMAEVRGKFEVYATVTHSERSKRSLRIAERLGKRCLLNNVPILERDLSKFGGEVTKLCSRSMVVMPFFRPDKFNSAYAAIGIESMTMWTEKRAYYLMERMLMLSIFARIAALPGVTVE